MSMIMLEHEPQDLMVGTYLIAGPDWDGNVPEGMTEIWSPTNLAWILQRTLLEGTEVIWVMSMQYRTK